MLHFSEGNARRHISLEIAGLGMTLASVRRNLEIDVHEVVKRFEVASSGRGIRVTVDWLTEGMERDVLSRAKLVFSSGQLWRLYALGEELWFHFSSPRFEGAAYKMARFLPDFSSGVIYLKRTLVSGVARPLEYPLDELIWMHWLPAHRGLELHSCGLIDDDGRGYLFVGPSGAGKTTTARIWQRCRGATILSDDRIILREQAGAIWMCGTPWHGEAELASPARARLHRIFLLEQAARTELRELSPAAASTRLLACSFVPFHDGAALSASAQFLSDLVGRTPCHELRFLPDATAVEAVLSGRGCPA